ncbi:MAG: hypothetical protein R3240_02155 [Gammaproteobacteria bacterium]|nr:hypothetical protein [Gammaproteobacteria bacterium]
MKSWFKSLFDSDSDNKVRQLSHPRDLQIGDIIKFRLLPQCMINNARFEVSSINTYDFEDRKLTEFVLQGNGAEACYLTVDETGDEPFLAISQKVSRDMVEQIFDLDEFALLFDDESHNKINRQREPEALQGWTADFYIQEIFCERGYFFKGDYRERSLPQSESEGESFDYYLAIDNSRQFVVEAEVYDGGETDVLITVRRSLDSIEEMWPASNG